MNHPFWDPNFGPYVRIPFEGLKKCLGQSSIWRCLKSCLGCIHWLPSICVCTFYRDRGRATWERPQNRRWISPLQNYTQRISSSCYSFESLSEVISKWNRTLNLWQSDSIDRHKGVNRYRTANTGMLACAGSYFGVIDTTSIAYTKRFKKQQEAPSELIPSPMSLY